MEKTHPIKPMPISIALLYFGVPLLLFAVIQRIAMPFLDASGISPLANFFVMMLPHILFFFGALIAYRMEGNLLNWAAFSQRFRLTPIKCKRLGLGNCRCCWEHRIISFSLRCWKTCSPMAR